MSLQLELQRTKADVYGFAQYYFKKNLWIKLFGVFIVAAFLGATRRETFEFSAFLDVFYKSILVIIALFFVVYMLSLFSLSRKKYLLEKTIVRLEEDGIYIDSESKQYFFKWKSVTDVSLTTDYLYFKATNKITVLPRRFFETNEIAEIFHAYIQQHILQTHPEYRPGAAKHLYYWGLLGLLPTIGSIAGVILLYKGLNTYKDKKLVYIALADIFFFFIILGCLFFIQHREDPDELTTQTQKQVNGLIKEIEFFRIQHGSFPENLQEFTDVPFVWIDDPMLSTKHQQVNFHYKKIRNRYTLFSVGLDRKPYTKDDIYPTITKGDTLRFSLIKE